MSDFHYEIAILLSQKQRLSPFKRTLDVSCEHMSASSKAAHTVELRRSRQNDVLKNGFCELGPAATAAALQPRLHLTVPMQAAPTGLLFNRNAVCSIQCSSMHSLALVGRGSSGRRIVSCVCQKLSAIADEQPSASEGLHEVGRASPRPMWEWRKRPRSFAGALPERVEVRSWDSAEMVVEDTRFTPREAQNWADHL